MSQPSIIVFRGKEYRINRTVANGYEISIPLGTSNGGLPIEKVLVSHIHCQTIDPQRLRASQVYTEEGEVLLHE